METDSKMFQLNHSGDNPSKLNSTVVVVSDPGFEGAASQSAKLMDAVLVKNAYKTYEFGQPVLNKLNMTVQRGTIYGLLGASGCGKTTILSCIVGLKKLDRGDIKVFGAVPGTKQSGKTIGYMPQDIALYEIFTIKESLQYFGRIYGMTPIEVRARMEFLINFLDLPECTRRIGSLSGGEKRRSSLAMAMLHQPELLLLDEPTVGVDPLLRQSIWKHLFEMVQTRRTTIIITTHYIEEAKQFDAVGVMRNGRLLVETSPLQLLKDHGTEVLENIVLQLCKNDSPGVDESENVDKFSKTASESRFRSLVKCLSNCALSKDDKQCNNKVIGLCYKTKQENSEMEQGGYFPTTKKFITNNLKETFWNHLHIIQSLTIRNFLQLIRTPWFFFAIIFIPAIQVILGNFIIGRVPKNTAMGVVNNDVHSTNLLHFCKSNPTGCLADNLSCNFLNLFPPEEIKWVHHSTEQEALTSVQDGNTWGFISIPTNYTQYLRDRSLEKNFVNNETLDGSTISSRLDASFNLKSDFIKSVMFTRFQEFLKRIVSDCNGDARSVEIPLKYNAIFGSLNLRYREFFLPAQLILIMFLLPMVSSLGHIRDKKAGTLDRSMVAGVQNFHYVFALLIIEGLLMITQLSICFGVLVFGFDFVIVGSSLLFMFILFLQGITGMAVGFLFGSFCDHELELVLSLIGVYMPIMVASGATWPIEGLPPWARVVSYSLPTTLSIESLRSIVGRGWGLSHPRVWPAFGVMGGWIIGSCILSGIFRRIRNQ